MNMLPHDRAMEILELACVYKGEISVRYRPDETERSYVRYLEWCDDLQTRMVRCNITRLAPGRISLVLLQVDILGQLALSLWAHLGDQVQLFFLTLCLDTRTLEVLETAKNIVHSLSTTNIKSDCVC